MHRVCRALLRDYGTAPDSSQAAIETKMAVILELWRGFFFFSLCCGRAALLSVCAHAQSDRCSYVFVDLGLLDLYMIRIHLTVDLRCCASVSSHGVVRSAQVFVKNYKVCQRCAPLRAHTCSLHLFHWSSIAGGWRYEWCFSVIKGGIWTSRKENPTMNVSKPCFQRPEFTIRGRKSRPTVWANCMATVKQR